MLCDAKAKLGEDSPEYQRINKLYAEVWNKVANYYRNSFNEKIEEQLAMK